MRDIVSLPMESPGPGVESKYRLAVLAAQRALQIVKGSDTRIPGAPYRKPTTIALAELQEGLVPFCTGAEADKARSDDEEKFREVIQEARAAYVDEEGNTLFGPSSGHSDHRSPEPPAPVG